MEMVTEQQNEAVRRRTTVTAQKKGDADVAQTITPTIAMVEDIVFEMPVPHLLEEIAAVVQFPAQAHMEIFVSRFKEDFVEMFQVPSQERTFEHMVDRTAEFIVPQIQENIAQMLFQVPIQERSQERIVEKSFPRSAFLGSSKRVTLAGTLRRGFFQAVRQDENVFSSGNTIF